MGSKTMYLYRPETIPSGSSSRPGCAGCSQRRAASFFQATISCMRAGAVLDEEDALGPAELGDALDVEGDVPADVHEDRGARPLAGHRLLEGLEGQAQVLAVAVDEGHARARVHRGQRRGHERVRGA